MPWFASASARRAQSWAIGFPSFWFDWLLPCSYWIWESTADETTILYFWDSPNFCGGGLVRMLVTVARHWIGYCRVGLNFNADFNNCTFLSIGVIFFGGRDSLDWPLCEWPWESFGTTKGVGPPPTCMILSLLLWWNKTVEPWLHGTESHTLEQIRHFFTLSSWSKDNLYCLSISFEFIEFTYNFFCNKYIDFCGSFACTWFIHTKILYKMRISTHK